LLGENLDLGISRYTPQKGLVSSKKYSMHFWEDIHAVSKKAKRPKAVRRITNGLQYGARKQETINKKGADTSLKSKREHICTSEGIQNLVPVLEARLGLDTIVNMSKRKTPLHVTPRLLASQHSTQSEVQRTHTCRQLVISIYRARRLSALGCGAGARCQQRCARSTVSEVRSTLSRLECEREWVVDFLLVFGQLPGNVILGAQTFTTFLK
jgi:hypothetical protein